MLAARFQPSKPAKVLNPFCNRGIKARTLGQPCLAILVGLLEPLRGLQLLEVPLGMELSNEALSGALALHQRGVQLGVVVRVQLFQELGAGGAVDFACRFSPAVRNYSCDLLRNGSEWPP